MKPFTMCSRQEVAFRQASGEISPLEATSETATLAPSKRRLDPTKAVKKYRRSAAGSAQEYPVRNLAQLAVTVDYLIQLLIQWPNHRHHNDSSDPDDDAMMIMFPPTTDFLLVVHFVEDRIRAIQVDLVVSCQASPALQYRLVKVHLLILYLLGDAPAGAYEAQYGKKALHTALQSYWNHPPANTQEKSDDDDDDDDDAALQRMNDEILAWTCLVHLNQDLTHLSSDSSADVASVGAGIMAIYRKHVATTSTASSSSSSSLLLLLPCFQWSLRILVACNTGEWSTALRLLLLQQQSTPAFGTLAATCLASHLPLLRARALQAYNLSFMKGEQVTATDVARHLAISDPTAAVAFCETVHLPIVRDNNDVQEEPKIAFKTAPINLEQVIKGTATTATATTTTTTTTTHRDDAFVFGDRNIRLVKDRHGFCLPSSKDMAALLQS